MKETEIPALLVACPTCARQPHECCVDEDRREIDYVHEKRVMEAAWVNAETEGGGNVVITDEMVLKTGLI